MRVDRSCCLLLARWHRLRTGRWGVRTFLFPAKTRTWHSTLLPPYSCKLAKGTRAHTRTNSRTRTYTHTCNTMLRWASRGAHQCVFVPFDRLLWFLILIPVQTSALYTPVGRYSLRTALLSLKGCCGFAPPCKSSLAFSLCMAGA